jgi:hypothetical protein
MGCEKKKDMMAARVTLFYRIYKEAFPLFLEAFFFLFKPSDNATSLDSSLVLPCKYPQEWVVHLPLHS